MTEKPIEVEITVESLPAPDGSIRDALGRIGLGTEPHKRIDYGRCPKCNAKKDFIGCPNAENHAIRPVEQLPPEDPLPIYADTERFFSPHATVVHRKRRFFIGRWYIGWQQNYRWNCVNCVDYGPWIRDRRAAYHDGVNHEITL